MEYRAIVGVLNGLGQLGDEPGCLPDGNRIRLPIEPFGERLAGAEDRGDEADRADLARLVDGNQVRMVEARGGSGFAVQSPPCIRAHQKFGPRDFQCDFAAQLRIERQKHDAAAALPELPAQFETTDAVDFGKNLRCGEGIDCWRIGEQVSERALVQLAPGERFHQPFVAGQPRGQILEVQGWAANFNLAVADPLIVRRQKASQVFVEVKGIGRSHRPSTRRVNRGRRRGRECRPGNRIESL